MNKIESGILWFASLLGFYAFFMLGQATYEDYTTIKTFRKETGYYEYGYTNNCIVAEENRTIVDIETYCKAKYWMKLREFRE